MKKILVLLLVALLAMTSVFAAGEGSTDTVLLTYNVEGGAAAKFTASQITSYADFATATGASDVVFTDDAKTASWYATYYSNINFACSLKVYAETGVLTHGTVTSSTIPYTLTVNGTEATSNTTGVTVTETSAVTAMRVNSYSVEVALGTVPADAASGAHTDTIKLELTTQ